MSCILVGGAPRTGTTVMHLLLCQGVGANPFVSEASYLRRLVEAYADARSGNFSSVWDYFDSPDDLRTFHASLVTAFLDRTRRRFSGTTRLVLKEPTLTRFFPEVDALLGPEARLVCMVRDPRDTIASLIEVGERQAAAGMGDAISRERLQEVCAYYRSYYLPIFRAADPTLAGRILWVKYEDLAGNPERVIDALERQLALNLSRARHGATPDTGRVDYAANAGRRSPWHSPLYGKAISPERIGAYRTVLKPQEVAFIERDLGDLFDVFHFERSTAAADAPADATRKPASAA